MKILIVLFFSFFTTIIYCQDLSTITINNFERIYDSGRLKTIIYYIPFYVESRSALNIDDVKRTYYIKIESRNNDSEIYNFIKGIENTRYNLINDNSFDLRCVVEFYYDNVLFFTYNLDQFSIVIDDKRVEYDVRFYNFVLRYLPRNYEEEFINYIR